MSEIKSLKQALKAAGQMRLALAGMVSFDHAAYAWDVVTEEAAECIATLEVRLPGMKTLKWRQGAYITTDDDNGPMEGIPRRLHAWRAGPYTIIRQRGEDGLFILRGLSKVGPSVFPDISRAKDAARADSAAIREKINE